ncbi:MAG: hypothetical protein QM689_03690 [Oscillospiraceae bacterium]
MKCLRIVLSVCCAAVLLTGTVLSASAAEFKADKKLLTADKSAPTVSFDMDKWQDYIKLTADGESVAGMKLATEDEVRYQAQCLKLTANLTQTIDASTSEEQALGIQINAADFGIKNFKGCTISMFIKPNDAIYDKIASNTCYVYGSNEDESVSSTKMRVEVSNSVTASAFFPAILTLDDKTDWTSFVIKVPFLQPYSGDVLYVDNITIETPLKDKDDKALILANVDGFNTLAKVENIDTKLHVGIQADSIAISTTETDNGLPVGVIIVIVAVVLLGGGAAAYFIKKKRDRFY